MSRIDRAASRTSTLRASFFFPFGSVAVFASCGLAVGLIACSGAQGRSFDSDAGASQTADSGTGDDAGGGQSPDDAGSFVDAAGNGACQRDLTVGLLSISNSACYVNTQVESKTSELDFPCAGGAATITFGTQKFSGKVNGDLINLKNVENFDYDGCPWESTQTINGDLTTGSLDYTYSEKPLQTCPDQYPCTANGTLDAKGGPVKPR